MLIVYAKINLVKLAKCRFFKVKIENIKIFTKRYKVWQNILKIHHFNCGIDTKNTLSLEKQKTKNGKNPKKLNKNPLQ